MSNLSRVSGTELIRIVRPPMDAEKILERVKTFQPDLDPELNPAYGALIWITREIILRFNGAIGHSFEQLQEVNIDSLALFFRDNPHWIENFELKSNTVTYKDEPLTQDMYGTTMTPIDCLSMKLYEAYPNKGKFSYSFLISAIKKALKLKFMPEIENYQYMSETLKTETKYMCTLTQLISLFPAGFASRKAFREALGVIGWKEKKYDSNPNSTNVYYLNPNHPKAQK